MIFFQQNSQYLVQTGLDRSDENTLEAQWKYYNFLRMMSPIRLNIVRLFCRSSATLFHITTDDGNQTIKEKSGMH